MIQEVTIFEEVIEERPQPKVKIHRTPATAPMITMQASPEHLKKLREAVRNKKQQMFSFERRTCWSAGDNAGVLG